MPMRAAVSGGGAINPPPPPLALASPWTSLGHPLPLSTCCTQGLDSERLVVWSVGHLPPGEGRRDIGVSPERGPACSQPSSGPGRQRASASLRCWAPSPPELCVNVCWGDVGCAGAAQSGISRIHENEVALLFLWTEWSTYNWPWQICPRSWKNWT